jgi:AmmeMemoRadiSam system protein B
MKTMPDVRPSPIAGYWYSDDPQVLTREIDGYLANASLPDLPGQVVAVIAPHAGHRYSGPVAGHAFRAVSGQQVDLVAIISPMHRAYFQPLLTSAHTAYETPLGIVPIDRKAVDAVDADLKAALGFGLTRISNDEEHSLEIELPFLQRALKGEFKLLPVMVREQAPEVTSVLGKALAKILHGRSCLLVASTDLSHFYPQQTANKLDHAMLDQVAAFSPQGLYEVESTGQGFACGLGALATVLWAARDLGADRAQLLNYATSGDVTGDFSSVVGYGAAVVLKTT